MTQSVRDLENTFVRSWQLLVRNPIIIVPPLVLGVAGGALALYASNLVHALIFTGASDATVNAVSQTIDDVFQTVVTVAVAILEIAFVTGMAGAAWRTGRTRLSDGQSAFTHRGLQILAAMALLFIIGVCAAALAPVTFLVSLIAYAVFFIYTMAAVIIGDENAVEALGESCRLAAGNIGPTLAVIGLIVAITVVEAVTITALGAAPNWLVFVANGLLQQIVVTYAALVVAGEYLKLRGQPTA